MAPAVSSSAGKTRCPQRPQPKRQARRRQLEPMEKHRRWDVQDPARVQGEESELPGNEPRQIRGPTAAKALVQTSRTNDRMRPLPMSQLEKDRAGQTTPRVPRQTQQTN